jgi:hypothetical protein
VPSHSPWIRIGCGDIFPKHALGQSFQVVIFAGKKEMRFGVEVAATDDLPGELFCGFWRAGSGM